MIRPLIWLPLAALSLTPAFAQDASLMEQAQKLHDLAGGELCKINDGFVPDGGEQSWTFTYQPSWSDDAEPEEVTLFQLFCMSGAYNISHSYYIHREFEGLSPVAFAQPVVEPKYVNDDYDGELEAVPVVGFTAVMTLVNSDFDPDTLSITSYSKWRGIGDASSAGTWVFKDGEFVLKRYDVDASYDGEMNPETIIDYTSTQAND